MPSTFPGILGLIACEVDQINWPAAREEVDGGEEDKKRGAEYRRDEVETEMVPEVMEVLDGEGGKLRQEDGNEGREEQIHPMGDEVVITKLDIFELDGLLEIREPGG